MFHGSDVGTRASWGEYFNSLLMDFPSQFKILKWMQLWCCPSLWKFWLQQWEASSSHLCVKDLIHLML
jgi:hypothetical protein